MTVKASFSLFLLLSVFLSSCGTGVGSPFGKTTHSTAPAIINVSSYDPKERQRKGRGYTPLDQSALTANGALALIARAGKGNDIDKKCADFLVGAERQGMKLGAYYYLKPHISIKVQAQKFVARMKTIKKSRSLRTDRILMVGDIDSKCSSAQVVGFIEEMERLTGKTPVIYLENSAELIDRLAAAPEHHKAVIRRSPYWLALYSNTNDKNPHIRTPRDLTKAYNVWNDWALWQYGGVFWERGRSAPKVYRHGTWQPSLYFGNMDRPMERNAFNGSRAEFEAFWLENSWKWK